MTPWRPYHFITISNHAVPLSELVDKAPTRFRHAAEHAVTVATEAILKCLK